MSKTYKHQATYDYLHHNKKVKGKLLKGIKKFFMNINFPRWDGSRRSLYKHKILKNYGSIKKQDI